MSSFRVILALVLFAGVSHAGDDHKDEEKHGKGEKHAEGEKHADGEKGEHEEAANPNVGAGKAVEAIDHDKGMKLSAKAAAALGVKTAPIAGSDPYRVKAASLVFFQDEVGVYRLRDGWLKLIEVQVIEKSKKDAVVRTREMKRGDQIVVAGAALIRVTELDLSSGDMGHGH